MSPASHPMHQQFGFGLVEHWWDRAATNTSHFTCGVHFGKLFIGCWFNLELFGAPGWPGWWAWQPAATVASGLPCCPHCVLWPQLEIPRESLQNGQVLTAVPYQIAPQKPLRAPCPAHTDCLACLLHALAVQPKWAALTRVCLHSTGTAATRALLLSKGSETILFLDFPPVV